MLLFYNLSCTCIVSGVRWSICMLFIPSCGLSCVYHMLLSTACVATGCMAFGFIAWLMHASTGSILYIVYTMNLSQQGKSFPQCFPVYIALKQICHVVSELWEGGTCSPARSGWAAQDWGGASQEGQSTRAGSGQPACYSQGMLWNHMSCNQHNCKRVIALEQEVASQCVIAKVCSETTCHC